MLIRTALHQANEQKKAKIITKINWLQQETQKITAIIQRAQMLELAGAESERLIKLEEMKLARYNEALNTLETVPLQIKRLNKELRSEKKQRNNLQEIMRLERELNTLWHRVEQALKC